MTAIFLISFLAATRFEVSKLVASTLVQALVHTKSRSHTFGIIRLMNSLITDNDRASSLFGAEGAIAPLIATMVSSEQQSSANLRNSVEFVSESWDTQTAAATALNCIASCNGALLHSAFPSASANMIPLAKNKELVNNANGISAILLLLGESYRGREKVFHAVLKLLGTLVSNPGIANIYCDSKQHPDGLATMMSLIRNSDRPFLIRRCALRVVAELSRHEETHTLLGQAGCDSNLFITVLHSARTNEQANESLTPPVVACISRLSVNGPRARFFCGLR